MIRTAFLAFAAFALDPSPPDISEAQAKAVAYKAYLCGSIDWQTRNNVRENDEASAARTRELARSSGCDEVRKLIAVSAP